MLTPVRFCSDWSWNGVPVGPVYGGGLLPNVIYVPAAYDSATANRSLNLVNVRTLNSPAAIWAAAFWLCSWGRLY